mmetsp:Transcript_22623/g.60644  ORF Transcript_22623/g.60644 Transcript_22623/m.60644 type:complete len:207 (-) Transcript_22623:1048-1668(-)
MVARELQHLDGDGVRAALAGLVLPVAAVLDARRRALAEHLPSWPPLVVEVDLAQLLAVTIEQQQRRVEPHPAAAAAPLIEYRQPVALVVVHARREEEALARTELPHGEMRTAPDRIHDLACLGRPALAAPADGFERPLTVAPPIERAEDDRRCANWLDIVMRNVGLPLLLRRRVEHTCVRARHVLERARVRVDHDHEALHVAGELL